MQSSSTPSALTDATPPPPISFWQAFSFWLKLGFISFGGPAGQIRMAKRNDPFAGLPKGAGTAATVRPHGRCPRPRPAGRL